ncbi:MAG: sensor histidine kinase [Solirubrobacteraceae bacterium]
MTFRARLLLTSLVTLAVGLGALVVAGNVLLDRRVEAETGSLLRARVDAEVAALAVTPSAIRVRETANDEALDKQAWVFSEGRAIERPAGVRRDLDAAAVALGRSTTTAEAGGPDDFRLRAQPVIAAGGRQVGTVVVAESTAALEHLQEGVLAGSAVVALLVMLAGGLAIRSAVDGALRPVAEMTASARDWGAHDLERRFALGPARDELTGLAAMLDGLLARIAASRRHEQRFASEVAHELRTPLAAMRGRAELALRDHDERGHDAALESIVEQADRLATTIDTLVAAARQDLGEPGATVDLAALARELTDVELVIHEPVAPAEGDPDVVRRALAPLIENARRLARSTVAVEVGSPGERVSLVVTDDGPGVSAGLAARIFEPGFQSGPESGGAGLGLPLARRLARSCGGDVVAAEGPGGHFTLWLPRADH